MFNFLLSEVWLMETIITALSGAVVSLLVALFAIGPKLKAIGTQLKTHDNDSCTRKTELSSEHELLARDLSTITGTVTYLKEGRIADEARRESMKGQMLDSQKALVVLEASLSQMADLNARLSEAKKEIAALQKENDDLRRENATLHQELDQNLDRDGEELEM